MVEEPTPDSGHSESTAALAGAWESLAEAKAKRRNLRLVTADFLDRSADVFSEEIERSMRPKT